MKKEYRKNYRKTYEQFYQCSLLPGIDIHHIDGDHSNNNPANLKAVTLEEHYEIHRSQKEYYAAYLIGRRMKIKPEDWEQMARENGTKSGKLTYERGTGIFQWRKENPEEYLQMCSRNGKKGSKRSIEEKLGLFSATPEQKREWCSMGGKAAPGFKLGHASSAGKKGGKAGGESAKVNKTGIFSLTPEQKKQRHMNSVISRLIKNGKACAWPRKDV